MRPFARKLVFLAAAGGLLLSTPLSPLFSKNAWRDATLRCEFTVANLSAGTREIAVWVPLPPSNEFQSLKEYKVEGPWRPLTLTESVYGNRILKLVWNGAPPPALAKGAVSFSVSRRLQTGPAKMSGPPGLTEAEKNRFLAADALVPVSGRIAEEAKAAVGEEKDDLAKMRRLYDHIVSTMRYDKSGKNWGRGDAQYACSVRRGNCTDFHSLMIAEARAVGVPARFVMGVLLPPGFESGEIPGYHCWAEFYLPGKGWVPVDAALAFQHPEKRDFFFGNLGSNHIQFSIGRDIRIPSAHQPPLNYFIYPLVEVDGHSHPDVETRFSFRG